MPKRLPLLLIRIAITLLVVILAAFVARWLWVHYELAPWTRDGRVRADVVGVAPDVSGFATEVSVVDNQMVHKGQLLFQLDRARYEVALHQAEAALAQAQAAPPQAQAAIARDSAALAQARRESARDIALKELVSAETREQGRTKVQEAEAALQQARANLQQAQAALQQAHAALDAAHLNLQRSTVYAPVNGVVTNVELRPGDYLTVGRQALALVDADSLHVDGYFEETKLPRIRVGDRVYVRLMGEPRPMYGHVESIAAAIEDRERTPTSNLVANVNPTFSWVRLAQRVPVRVALDHVPAGIRLIAGRTATVVVQTPHPVVDRGDWWSWR